jgi:hypothetical protein
MPLIVIVLEMADHHLSLVFLLVVAQRAGRGNKAPPLAVLVAVDHIVIILEAPAEAVMDMMTPVAVVVAALVKTAMVVVEMLASRQHVGVAMAAHQTVVEVEHQRQA